MKTRQWFGLDDDWENRHWNTVPRVSSTTYLDDREEKVVLYDQHGNPLTYARTVVGFKPPSERR